MKRIYLRAPVPAGYCCPEHGSREYAIAIRLGSGKLAYFCHACITPEGIAAVTRKMVPQPQGGAR